MKTNKKGISLIVLVITIIVMIILATAIILSLNSSNISTRANEAKTSSDLSNKKEAASVYVSEYEIKVAKGKIDKNTTSADEYVKSEMKKAGIDTSDVAVTEEGDILIGIAALFVNKEVPIGTTVDGYKLNNTTSYTTSGKENTCSANNTETDPQPATLTRDENITWKYMGIDENGEALIVGSVTENSPKMILGGKGGYLSGSEELNSASEALYSSNMGIARSINIEDVTRVLEYTGEKGSYNDPNNSYKPMEKAKTINQIGYDMNNFHSQTPEEGKGIGTYKSDYYYINKTADASEFNSSNADIVDLIYPGTTSANSTLTTSYWLSSPCVRAYFNSSNYADFDVRYVVSTNVGAYRMFASFGYSVDSGDSSGFAIRPVVSLNSSVQMTYEDGVVTLK